MLFPECNIDTTPIYFCIRCNGYRDEIQKKLAMENIYAPIIWPKSKYLGKINSSLNQFFYNDLLCIPCDQRYNLHDMDRIVEKTVYFKRI